MRAITWEIQSKKRGNAGWLMVFLTTNSVLLSFIFVFCMTFFMSECLKGNISNRPVQEDKWNFIVILLDDAGWKDVGFSGSDYIETPNMDRIAHNGFRLTTAYATHPFCAPTRESMISGMWPARTAWKRHSEVPNPAIQLPAPSFSPVGSYKWAEECPEFVSLAQALKAQGYITGHVGKWHFSLDACDITPAKVGFDINFGGSPMVGAVKDFFAPYDGLPGNVESEPGEYLTERLTDEAIDFIRHNKDQPFFIQLWHYAPHSPIMAREKDVDKYRTKLEKRGDSLINPTYAAMIDNIDQGVGRILTTLEELNLEGQTVIFITSDNGAKKAFGSVPIAETLPFRGQKGQVYEGGVRVPMAINWPGHTIQGGLSDEMVSVLDFYPTILDIAGIPLPSGQPVDGKSLVPLITEGEQPELVERPHFWYNPTHAIEESEGSITQPIAAVRLGDWKLIHPFGNPLELYNLQSDPSESVNQADRMPLMKSELKTLLDEWLAETDIVLPVPNPNYDPDFLLPCQVMDKLFIEDQIMKSWTFDNPDPLSWTSNNVSRIESLDGFVRVFSEGIYPRFSSTGNVNLPAGVYLVQIEFRIATDGRVRFHWSEEGANDGTIEMFPNRDGKWQKLTGIFRATSTVTSFSLACPTHIDRLGFYDPRVDPDYADVKSISIMKVSEP